MAAFLFFFLFFFLQDNLELTICHFMQKEFFGVVTIIIGQFYLANDIWF